MFMRRVSRSKNFGDTVFGKTEIVELTSGAFHGAQPSWQINWKRSSPDFWFLTAMLSNRYHLICYICRFLFLIALEKSMYNFTQY